MANIKISELNATTNLNNNDLIPVVDITNSETKKITKENFMSTTSEIDNTYGTSTSKGYSQNYINACNTYSTSEVNTGKTWIDGKPIYRRGFQFTFQASSGENSFNTDVSSIANFDSFVSLNFEAKFGTNLYLSQNFYNASNNFVFMFYRNKKIEYRVGASSSIALTGYAFLEYTKTTD